MNIYYNPSLNDITALNSINNVGQIIRVYGNSNLKICSINIVCDFLENNITNIGIGNNKNGCNNKDEVKTSCETLSINENIKRDINVFPNPTKSYINLSYGDIIPKKIELFDMNGRAVLTTTRINSIDMNSLSKGTYILKFLFDRGVYLSKIIKD